MRAGCERVPVEPVGQRRRRQLVLVSMVKEYARVSGDTELAADADALAGRLLLDLDRAEAS